MGSGPLQGVKIIEFAGIGPGPFAGMLLSDMGAEVLRIDRKQALLDGSVDITARGRKSVCLDLRKPAAVEAVKEIISSADALIEGYRPGVMEKLGLGPDILCDLNPRLVYGRMTGWGQDGPLAHSAGHDINYISLCGALDMIGTREQPVPPLNLVGDYGGGALYLAMGICAALFEAQRSGKGQVIDCAITDGTASLMAMFFGFHQSGFLAEGRDANMLDGGAHFYGAYETADGKFISIGPIEPQFYAVLRELAGLEDDAFDAQYDPAKWPELKQTLAGIFKTKTRDEWDKLLAGTDACYAPVLSLSEAKEHPHNKARDIITHQFGIDQPNVAPRFSRTPGAIQGPPVKVGEDNETGLTDWGLSGELMEKLKAEEAF
ncbi:MAG: CaiB/BaiF CoA transferase family protein [Parvibaculales bacterium]